VRVPIYLEDVVKGVIKTVKITSLVSCIKCDRTGSRNKEGPISCNGCGGTGRVNNVHSQGFVKVMNSAYCNICRGAGVTVQNKCSLCLGEGRKKGTKKVSIDVPRGVSSDLYNVMQGKGNAGLRGGITGDLLVYYNEVPHKLYKRKGSDIFLEKWVVISTAVLGGSVTVATLHGAVNIKVPPCTKHGTDLRLKGKGLPIMNSTKIGNQLVTIMIKIPDELDEKSKKLFTDLKENGY
jgi:molecular chaperone DnaJ